jgi:hypothetical protein
MSRELSVRHAGITAGTSPASNGQRPVLPAGGLMAHCTEPRFAPALRKLTPPREYALAWRATVSAAGLFSQLGATVPARGFHLAYSPGFRDGILGGHAPVRDERPFLGERAVVSRGRDMGSCLIRWRLNGTFASGGQAGHAFGWEVKARDCVSRGAR